jgi:RNA polymerase sigma-70 factor, ECF subfamily
MVAVNLRDRARLGLTFEAFFQAHHTRLLRALYVLTGSLAESEDLAQEAFLRLWHRWDQVRHMEDPEGYLFRTALNVARSYHRRIARRIRAPRPPDNADGLSQSEDRLELARAVKQLPMRQRMALILIDLLEFSSEESARILGVKAVTVRVLASQARSRLRTELGG